MNILIISSTFLPTIGGTEIVVANLAKGLSESGHAVTLVCPRAARSLRGTVPYRIRSLPPGIFRLYQASEKLGTAAMKLYLRWLDSTDEFDLVQWVMAYPLALAVDNVFKENGIPQIVRGCGADIQKRPDIQYGERCDPAKDKLISAAVRRFDHCVANSASAKDDFLDMGVPEERVTMIPNGVDYLRLAGHGATREKIRQELSLNSQLLLITIGRNHPKKGFSLIPGIARLLRDRGVDFVWILVGKETENLASELERVGVKERFRLEGEIGIENYQAVPAEGLARLLGAADILVFPTLVETFGMVSIEAMAAGCIVVTSNVEGSRDIISDKVDGVLCRAGDVEDFASTITKLSIDKKMLKTIRDAASKKAQRYDWSHMTSSFVELYKKVRTAL